MAEFGCEWNDAPHSMGVRLWILILFQLLKREYETEKNLMVLLRFEV